MEADKEVVRALIALDERMTSMDKRVETYNDRLQEHMRRTALLEQAHESEKKFNDFRHEAVVKKMEEISKKGSASNILVYVSIAAGICTILKLFLFKA